MVMTKVPSIAFQQATAGPVVFVVNSFAGKSGEPVIGDHPDDIEQRADDQSRAMPQAIQPILLTMARRSSCAASGGSGRVRTCACGHSELQR